MHVAHADADLLQIVREILRHALGQRRDEHTLAEALADPDLVQQVIHLAADRPYLDLRIDRVPWAE